MGLGRRKIVLVVGAVVLAVASPLAFTLGPAGVGDTVSGSIIAATAVAALAVPLWTSSTDGPEPDGAASGETVVKRTGRAQATGGGRAITGVLRLRGRSGRASAKRTGPAIAEGPGSRAVSGVEETDRP
jgi:hypothetical protein